MIIYVIYNKVFYPALPFPWYMVSPGSSMYWHLFHFPLGMSLRCKFYWFISTILLNDLPSLALLIRWDHSFKSYFSHICIVMGRTLYKSLYVSIQIMWMACLPSVNINAAWFSLPSKLSRSFCLLSIKKIYHWYNLNEETPNV